MSQHFFKTTYQNEPITIVMGWDRPLQGFFMFIEKPECKYDEERYLFCNLNEEDSHPKSLKGFLGVLRSFQLTLPEEMINEVVEDKMINCGNKRVEHQIENGEYKRIPGGGRSAADG